MTTLAISLSTPFGTIALSTPNGHVQAVLDGVQQHSALFFTTLDQLLAQHDLTSHDIQSIAVDIGPGSFMGVRSSISIAQALAFVNQCPIYAFSSLEALVHSVSLAPEQRLLTAQDARMGEWYYALWQQKTSGLVNILEPAVNAPEDIESLLLQHHASNAMRIGSAMNDQLISVQAITLLDRLAEKPALLPEALKPLYIRNNVASKPKLR